MCAVLVTLGVACVPQGTLGPQPGSDPAFHCGEIAPRLELRCRAAVETDERNEEVVPVPDGAGEASAELAVPCELAPLDDGDALRAGYAARCATLPSSSPSTFELTRELTVSGHVERICGTHTYGSSASVRPRWSFAIDLPERDEPWELEIASRFEVEVGELVSDLACAVEVEGESAPVSPGEGPVLARAVEGGAALPVLLVCDRLAHLGCFGYASGYLDHEAATSLTLRVGVR